MSTPPEAKQAAEKEFQEAILRPRLDSKPTGYHVQQAIAAATAKLREELERVNLEWKITKEAWQIEHKLREMAEQQLAHQQPSYQEVHEPLAGKFHEQVEQPSATDEPLFGEHIKEATKAIKPLFKPTSPTPDVEKLEWKLWSRGDNRVTVVQNNEIESIITPEPVSSEQGEFLRSKHNEALTQARAPLVKALTPFANAANELTLIGRSIKPEEQWLWKPSSTGRDTAGINAQNLLDACAALTGT